MASIDIHADFASNNPLDSEGMTYMIYTTDDGKKIALRIKEIYGLKFGFDPLPASGIPAGDRLPATVAKVEPRKIYAVDASGKIRQSFRVGKPSEPIYKEGGIVKIPRRGTSQGITLYVTGSVGEKRSYVASSDTGQEGLNPNS